MAHARAGFRFGGHACQNQSADITVSPREKLRVRSALTRIEPYCGSTSEQSKQNPCRRSFGRTTSSVPHIGHVEMRSSGTEKIRRSGSSSMRGRGEIREV